ncbi:hypothetical protein [Paracoccus sp. (in: a-proteobacteria)]|uniref:hypothetical protein n=1 Tax=Paracoccus sp. TaxID=267 RepID=UPI0035AECC2B
MAVKKNHVSNSTKGSQLDKFREAARQLETDDDDERFEKQLKKIVKQKPDDKKSPD